MPLWGLSALCVDRCLHERTRCQQLGTGKLSCRLSSAKLGCESEHRLQRAHLVQTSRGYEAAPERFGPARCTDAVHLPATSPRDKRAAMTETVKGVRRIQYLCHRKNAAPFADTSTVSTLSSLSSRKPSRGALAADWLQALMSLFSRGGGQGVIRTAYRHLRSLAPQSCRVETAFEVGSAGWPDATADQACTDPPMPVVDLHRVAMIRDCAG